MRTIALLLVAFSAPVLLPGQQQPNQPGQIAGRVVNAITGEPIRKAAVRIYPSGRAEDANPKYTVSDADGRFVFENVSPSTWGVMTERNGYLQLEDGRGMRRSRGLSVTLQSGQQVTDLEVKLTPQGVVTGTVLDPDGDPLPRVSVQVMPAKRSSTMNGRRGGFGGGFAGRGSAGGGNDSTNDLGEFRVAGLSPGKYWVLATAQGRRFPPNLEGAPSESTVPTYYPTGATTAEAVAIEVAPGQTATGIQIQVRRSAVYRVRGRVTALPPDSNARRFRVMLFSADHSNGSRFGGPGGPGGQLKPDGSFELSGVLPGQWEAVLMANDRRQGVAGRASISVSGDLDGVTIPVTEPISISGVIRVEGGGDFQVNGLNAMLLPDGFVPMGASNARIKADKTFQMENVSRDRYYLNLNGLPSTYYLKSVRLGPEECIDKGVDLTSAGPGAVLTVTLGTQPASVSGSVTDDGKPVGSVIVMVAPDPIHPNPSFRIYSGRTDTNGAFQIEGLAPGEYRVYAGDDLGNYIVNDEDFRKANESTSVKVSLKEGSSETVEVKSLTLQ